MVYAMKVGLKMKTAIQEAISISDSQTARYHGLANLCVCCVPPRIVRLVCSDLIPDGRWYDADGKRHFVAYWLAEISRKTSHLQEE
jgi:hypothetical protein